jgi:acyl dehydratase
LSPPRSRRRLNAAASGKTYPETTFGVTAEAIERYARATNDLNARYLAGEDAVAGPVWPVVPAFGHFMAAARDPELGVRGAGGPGTPDPREQDAADLRRLVHLSEEHVLRAPICPGDVLTVAGTLEAVDSDAGTFTVAVSERNQDGLEVAAVRATMLVRGAGRFVPAAPEEASGTTHYEHKARVDPDQAQRYALASGDHNPIHLDRKAARLAGLRGVILHGMCTMAVASAGAVDGLAGGDPTAVERVAVTFARPVFPGQELTTRFWAKSGTGEARLFGFSTVNEDGALVLTKAEALVRS